MFAQVMDEWLYLWFDNYTQPKNRFNMMHLGNASYKLKSIRKISPCHEPWQVCKQRFRSVSRAVELPLSLRFEQSLLRALQKIREQLSR